MQKKISTRDIHNGRFASHGEATYVVQGRLVISEVTGPMNVEMCEALSATFDTTISQMDVTFRNNWVEIIIAKKSGLATPEAVRAHRKFVEYRQRLGYSPKAIAVYLEDTQETPSFIDALWRDNFDPYGIPFMVSDDMDAVTSWLEQY